MPDRRTHRGPHPEDVQLFAPPARPLLCEATADLCWLLSRGYPRESALKLVGDRYSLLARQRTAISRCACSDAQAAARLARRVADESVAGQTLWIDGYNVLTSIESALAGGVILAARDGVYRDMASMHGSYRQVAETRPALGWLGQTLVELGVRQCVWLLDRPVSNSGRLRTVMLALAAERGWPWQVELDESPDRRLIARPTADQGADEAPAAAHGATAAGPWLVATADSAVLDRCGPWLNLARIVIGRHIPAANVFAAATPFDCPTGV